MKKGIRFFLAAAAKALEFFHVAGDQAGHANQKHHAATDLQDQFNSFHSRVLLNFYFVFYEKISAPKPYARTKIQAVIISI